jgi:hypothetical protein
MGGHTKSPIATCIALQVGELLNDSNDINKDINWRIEEGLCAFRRWASLFQALAHCEAGVKHFSLLLSI